MCLVAGLLPMLAIPAHDEPAVASLPS
jgi:hypothetical protein